MKLPKKYNFRDTQNPNVLAIVDDKERALCYVTKKLSQKENAELLIEGSGKPEGGANGSVVFDEKDEKSFTRLKLEYGARKLSCKGASLEKPFIIACDDVFVMNFLPIQDVFQSSLKKKRIEFEKFVFGMNNIESVHFGETESFGIFDVRAVSGQGSVKISGTPDRLSNLTIIEAGTRITLDFAYHSHTTVEPTTRDYLIQNSNVDKEKGGRSKKTVLKFAAGENIEITNMNIEMMEGSSEAFIKSSRNCKVRGIFQETDYYKPYPVLYLGGNTNVANFEAELRRLPSNCTQHSIRNLDAPNIDIRIKQSEKPEYSHEDAMRLDSVKIETQTDEKATLKINDTIDCTGCSTIVLDKNKKLDINRLKMFFSAKLDLSNCDLNKINELSIERSYIDGISVSDGSDEYLGKFHIKTLLTDSADGVKNISIDKNCNAEIKLTQITSPGSNTAAKYYLENLKFSGQENNLKIELDTENGSISCHLNNCEFLDANCKISGNKTVVIENSSISGENLFDNVLKVKDSEISNSRLEDVVEVYSSNISDSELKRTDEVLSSEIADCYLSVVEQINGYTGYGENHSNIERLIDKTNILKQSAKVNSLKIINDKNVRDIEL